MRLLAVVALSALVGTGGVELAEAQQARPLRPGEGTSFRLQPVHKQGVYGGVTPGKPVAKVYEKKRPVKNRSKRKNRVTWVGFQPSGDGSSRVFIQLTSQVPYTQRVEGDTLIVNLESARFGSNNAQRFLDTRFFDTALARVDADRARKGRRRARGVDVRIKFKNPAGAAQASASMSQNDADGYTYLFLDFPAPSGSASSPGDADEPEGASDSE
jgi:hypothetical protein